MSNWLDLSNSSNKLKQTYVSGFVDISGQGVNIRSGNLQLFDSNTSQPSFSINSNAMNIYDGIGNYIDVSNSKLIFLKDVSENIQVRLDDLISRTQHISTDIVNNRFSINSPLFVESNTTLSGDLVVTGMITGNIKIGGNTSINNDVNIGGNADVKGTLKTNDIIVNGNILPTLGITYNLGTESSPFNSLYVNKGTIYFTDTKDGISKTASTLSFDPSSGSLIVTSIPTTPNEIVPSPGTLLVSRNGNVGIGTNSPTYTLDVSGTTNLYGNVIVNDNLLIGRDISANGKFSIHGDASFGNDVTIAGNLRTHYPPASIPQSAISGGVGGIYIPTEITSFDDDMFALVKEFKQESTLIDASVNGNLSVSGSTKLNGNVVINGKVNINKDLYIAGNLSANYADQSIPISALQGNLKALGGGGSFYTPTEKTTFDEDRFALLKELDTSGGNTAVSDATVLGTLTVDGNAFLNSNVTITGDLSMIGNIYVSTQRLDDSSDKIATTSYVQNTLFRQFIP